MNLFFKNALILCVTVLSFTGCFKKGDDDPFVSLRTRKARITGYWTMTSGTSVTYVNSSSPYPSSSSGTYTTIYSKDNFTTIHKNTPSTKAAVSTGTCLYQMEFKRNGEFSSTALLYNSSKSVSGIGTWNFTGGIGKKKNKSQVVINFTTSQNQTHSGNKTYLTFDIKELSNKKLVLTSENTDTDYDSETSFIEEYTFEQK